MKKMIILLTVLCFILSACALPTAIQSQATSPAPLFSEADIQATVAIQVEQTLQSLPSPTLAPSTTPVVITATSAPTRANPTPTPTLTATISTLGTTGASTVTGTLPSTSSANATPTGTLHYQHYGTMPPNLPSGNIALLNMSKVEAYISLQCTTNDGYVTVIEYPVGGSRVNTSAPAGRYIYVAWVGGQKFTGSFKLDKFQDLKLTIYKNRIEIK